MDWIYLLLTLAFFGLTAAMVSLFEALAQEER